MTGAFERPLTVGLLAGEASGDILGAALIDALRQQHPNLRLSGIGGPLMIERGFTSLFPMDRLSVMGLVEPLKRLPELLRIRREVFEHFCAQPPDVFVGIDSPDFNLYLERKLRRHGITTAHLVSPSVWAWRQRRIHGIKKSVDLMLTLFPFETTIYEQHQIPVTFVGHPLADTIPMTVEAGATRQQLGLNGDGKVVALLPGSRGGEVGLLAPLFIEVARELHRHHGDLQFVIPAANEARYSQLQALMPADFPVTLVHGQSREAMTAADAVLLASGTATLEALLLKKPMLIAYKMSGLSWQIISRMVRGPFVGLPNILAGKALVPEYLQGAATVEAIVPELQALLFNAQQAAVQRDAFTDIHHKLKRDAASRAADALLSLVNAKSRAND